MEKFDWKTTIKINILFLRIVGLWPKGDETYKLDPYTFYAGVALMLFLCGHNFFQTFNIFFILDDLEAFTAAIFVTVTCLAAILKSYSLIQHMGTLKQLLNAINSDMFQPRNTKQRMLIEPSLNFWKMIYSLFGTMALGTLFFWTTYPILDNSVKKRRLPFLAWYPWHTTISPLYEITYIYQIASVWFIAAININTDTLIAALNMYTGAQCDILCDNLRNLHNSIKNDENDIDKKLLNCIEHHKAIVSFAENSNKFFNWIVLMQFFTCAVSIGLTMFQLTIVVPLSSEFYSFIFYGNSMTVQIFAYCWFGNEVEIKSSNIPYAIFESNWIEAPLQMQKKIIFFTLRTQKPIKLSALNLFYLSLETFKTIIRTAWSYFAVLHQVNAQN